MVALLRRYLSLRIVSEGTIEQYTLAARNWDTIVKLPPRRLSEVTFARFARRALAKGIGQNTVHTRMGTIASLWRFAADHGWARPVPRVRKVSRIRRTPFAWRHDQLPKLFAACSDWRPAINSRRATRGWSSEHMVALGLVLYFTSERISAMMAVTRDHLDVDGMLLHVPGEMRKGKREDKVYPLPREVVELLTKLPPSKRLFPWNGKLQTLRLHWKRILRVAGLPANRNTVFHCMRRTHATHMAIAAGVEAASRSTGHSSTAVTLWSYIDESQLPSMPASALLAMPLRLN